VGLVDELGGLAGPAAHRAQHQHCCEKSHAALSPQHPCRATARLDDGVQCVRDAMICRFALPPVYPPLGPRCQRQHLRVASGAALEIPGRSNIEGQRVKTPAGRGEASVKRQIRLACDSWFVRNVRAPRPSSLAWTTCATAAPASASAFSGTDRSQHHAEPASGTQGSAGTSTTPL